MNTIKEAVGIYIDGCEAKVKSSIGTLMVKALLAGMMIAMGAAGSSVAAHSISNVGLARFVSGAVFPVGLMMVVMLGAELFTGDCLMVMGMAEGKHSALQLIRVLVLVYFGNMIGSVLFAAATYGSGQWNYSNGLLGAYTIKVALGKCSLNFSTAFLSGILCNILVCIAVIMAVCAKDAVGKLLSSFFVIMLFVVGGYEHCVANMYYIPAGLFAKQNADYVQAAIDQLGVHAEELENLSISGFFSTNLIPVTFGNLIGGMLVVGLALWYCYGRKEQ